MEYNCVDSCGVSYAELFLNHNNKSDNVYDTTFTLSLKEEMY